MRQKRPWHSRLLALGLLAMLLTSCQPDADGTRVISPSATSVFVNVRNTDTRTAQLFETYSGVGTSPPAPP